MNSFFDNFQIVALIFFLLVFMGRTLYLRFSKGVQPITLGVGKRGYQRIVEIFFFVGLSLWMVEIVIHALNLNVQILPSTFFIQLPDSEIAKIIGVVIIMVGFGIFIYALASFGTSWRIGIDTQKPGDLVTTGIFAFSRNPIFVFIDLYFVGTFLINGTLIFLIFAVLMVLGLHYQILQEEKFLTHTYGNAYDNYRAGTGRYFMSF
jgi:protein-S-isoprenylcysteine O-methyltransferase Ste14